MALVLWVTPAYAQAPPGQAYIVRPGEPLTTIARKFFGEAQAYDQIIEATNAKAAEDDSFQPIDNPNDLVAGQKLWIPLPRSPETLTAQASDDFTAVDCTDFDVSPNPALLCGYVTVPTDHLTDTITSTIQLAVAVHIASSDNPQPDPIVYLQGGPGGAAVAGATFLSENFFAQETTDRDIVYIDQRGVGASIPNLSCNPELEPFALGGWDDRLAADAFLDDYFNALQTCLDRLTTQGIDLNIYNSAQNAADIIAVGEALGYNQINLYGISYGARLALTILRDFRTGYIRSAVIGGVYGPEANALEFGLNLHERIELLFDACANNSDCAAAYPNLRTRFYSYLAELDNNPVALTLELPTGDSIEAGVDDWVVYYALFQKLVGGRASITDVPRQLDALLNGDSQQLLEDGLVGQIVALLGLQNWGMNTAVQCQEEFLLLSPADIAATERATPPQIYNFTLRFQESSFRLPEFCANLDLTPADPSEDEPVRSGIPTLVVSGRFDPFTPPEWAERATARFTNRYIYTLENAGHDSAVASECSQSITHAFYTDPRRPPDISCLAEETLTFALPLTPQSFEPLKSVFVEPFSVTTVIPAAQAETFVETARYTDPAVPGVTLFIEQPSVSDVESVVDYFQSNLSLAVEIFDQKPLGRYEWTFLEGVVGESLIIIATTQTEDGTVYNIILGVSPADRHTATEALLIPALEAFRATE